MGKARVKLDEDEKERRRSLDLPLTKELKYVFRQGSLVCETKVLEYRVAHTYTPSETRSLKLILENGEEVRILAPFFAEMQTPAFERSMKNFFYKDE